MKKANLWFPNLDIRKSPILKWRELRQKFQMLNEFYSLQIF